MFISSLKRTMIALACSALSLSVYAKIPTNQNLTYQDIQALPASTNSTPTFLFNVSSADGSLKLDKQQNYILSIRLPDMEQVLMYSDRPNRIVKYITGKSLAKFWVSGENSFKNDPPNAILSSTHMRPTLVVLKDIKVNGTNAVFTMTSNRHLPIGELDHVSLNIDGAIGSCFWCPLEFNASI